MSLSLAIIAFKYCVRIFFGHSSLKLTKAAPEKIIDDEYYFNVQKYTVPSCYDPKWISKSVFNKEILENVSSVK